MNKLDDILTRLGAEPVHPHLALMDAGILAGLAANNAKREANIAQPLAVAAVAALVIGVASTGFSGTPALTSPALTLFGSSAVLAPSTLLLATK